MSIYDLSNCNCTMVGEEIQEKINKKKKMRFARKPGGAKWLSRFPIAQAV